jgi:hypothetical protein
MSKTTMAMYRCKYCGAIFYGGSGFGAHMSKVRYQLYEQLKPDALFQKALHDCADNQVGVGELIGWRYATLVEAEGETHE